jgi:ubiquinone/menaquinone biosynthesis C-methylase UbiE
MVMSRWVSPINKEPLRREGSALTDGVRAYQLREGIADLIEPQQLPSVDLTAKRFYEGRADDYEKYLPLTFKTYNEDEVTVREGMIDLLGLSKDSKVLEVACGTGRDSVLIAKRLGKNSKLFLTDISYDMLRFTKRKFSEACIDVEICMSNAMNLPCPDNYFDAVYSFGALGEFSDPSKFFSEVVRVCKPGARVVVGDENLPIWQRNTNFGEILSNYNRQFLASVPFESLPIQAREVRCQWIIGGVFYVIDFRVGVGEPYADFDFEIPGMRGGTHKTRFYGQLEGVKPETKELAWKARELLGLSMHSWLDEIVRKEAEKVLSTKPNAVE